MSDIKIDIKRTGFPVTIGDVELWFDSSLENRKKFTEAEQTARDKINEIKKKADELNIDEDNDAEALDKLFGYYKDILGFAYDEILGEGTFDKIYKEYPDFMALLGALPPLVASIKERIEELEYDQSLNQKNKHLNKKKG